MHCSRLFSTETCTVTYRAILFSEDFMKLKILTWGGGGETDFSQNENLYFWTRLGISRNHSEHCFDENPLLVLLFELAHI